ncbi:Golgi-associated kinase 1B isoform X2 [Pristis pectinata]|uniref:Golgi-associated kinase 1B isoform X2 n=1 Tax=Pristis pectinata TaxID=685728 RepID=UPI00223CFCE1|nr:Golgi-associated kinase 1B isoform X2 [Pristis pectinata]
MTSLKPGKLCFLLVVPCVWMTSGRRPKTRRNLLIAAACLLYAFVVMQGNVLFQVRIFDYEDNREAEPVSRLPRTLRAGESEQEKVTFNPNVVYITLRSKRIKPANIRGTVRPKLRKKWKAKRTQPVQDSDPSLFTSQDNEPIDQRLGGTENSVLLPLARAKVEPRLKSSKSTRERKSNQAGNPNTGSNIRIYSESAPFWFSKEDINAMRFLADSSIAQIHKVPQTGRRPLFLFEGVGGDQHLLNRREGNPGPRDLSKSAGCRQRCGVLKRPVDVSEVFAFHLDRILGLNRSLPAVARRVHFVKDGLPRPVILWDGSLLMADNDTQSTVKLDWMSYQQLLKWKCWVHGKVPKPDWRCTGIHHYEWCKLALFDFLLQVYNRLDRNCCGFRPRKEDTCAQNGLKMKCDNQDNISLFHILYRDRDPRHLVFIDNKGYFDRNEDNLNFKVLEGITEFLQRTSCWRNSACEAAPVERKRWSMFCIEALHQD